MIKPLNNNVVLKKEKKVNQTASGIVLSQKEEETEYAVVVATGPGKREKGELIPTGLNVGDKVIYKSYSPTKIKIDDEEYLIVDSESILAVLE